MLCHSKGSGYFLEKMKETFTILLLLLLISTPVLAQDIITIKEARSSDIGTFVRVEAVINGPDYGFNHGQFYIQDSTGGINIFFSNVGGENGASVAYNDGDTVRVTGVTSVFSNQLQITPNSVDLIGASDVLPEPIKITTEDLTLDSEFQGMRVQIEQVSLVDATEWPTDAISSGGGVNVNVEIGPEKIPLIIRIDRGQSAQDGSAAPEEPFILTGILGNFEETVQMYPFYESDIQPQSTTNTVEIFAQENSVKVYPNPARSEINLDVSPQLGDVIRATLFDITGKAVANFNALEINQDNSRLSLPNTIKAGSYHLILWTEKGPRSTKLVVLR